MKLMLLLLFLPSLSMAGTLTVRFTVPSTNNSQLDCTKTPILSPATDAVWAHTVIPTLGVHDSVWCVRGTVINKTYTAPPGAFEVTAYCARIGSGMLRYGCPTKKTFTVSADTLPPAPAAPVFK